jgi:hypothetical protein
VQKAAFGAAQASSSRETAGASNGGYVRAFTMDRCHTK